MFEDVPAGDIVEVRPEKKRFNQIHEARCFAAEFAF